MKETIIEMAKIIAELHEKLNETEKSKHMWYEHYTRKEDELGKLNDKINALQEKLEMEKADEKIAS